jgi:hypothetical protein
MNLGQLKATARSRADDQQTNYLWSDEEWTEYANDAQNQACRRARLIIDSTTTAITQLSMASGDVTASLDERILFIKRAKVSSVSNPLGRASFKDLDERLPGWEDATGIPQAYVPDMDTDKFRPYPTPDSAITVNLTVVRLPLEDMANDTDEPEINKRYHLHLVDWMLHRAYSKQDSETVDMAKANKYLATFEAQFGKESTANEENWINREHGFMENEGVY